jgi:hypothetical protein
VFDTMFADLSPGVLSVSVARARTAVSAMDVASPSGHNVLHESCGLLNWNQEISGSSYIPFSAARLAWPPPEASLALACIDAEPLSRDNQNPKLKG